MIKILNALKIFPRRYFYPSLDTLPYIKDQECLVSRNISSRILCLPLYHDLEIDNIELICNEIRKVIWLSWRSCNLISCLISAISSWWGLSMYLSFMPISNTRRRVGSTGIDCCRMVAMRFFPCRWQAARTALILLSSNSSEYF